MREQLNDIINAAEAMDISLMTLCAEGSISDETQEMLSSSLEDIVDAAESIGDIMDDCNCEDCAE